MHELPLPGLPCPCVGVVLVGWLFVQISVCNGYFGLFHLFSGCLNGIYDVYRKVLQDDRTT